MKLIKLIFILSIIAPTGLFFVLEKEKKQARILATACSRKLVSCKQDSADKNCPNCLYNCSDRFEFFLYCLNLFIDDGIKRKPQPPGMHLQILIKDSSQKKMYSCWELRKMGTSALNRKFLNWRHFCHASVMDETSIREICNLGQKVDLNISHLFEKINHECFNDK